jgi:phage portal protein BeeE
MNELNSCVFRCITTLVELLGILKSNLYKSNPKKKERERESGFNVLQFVP